MSRHVRAGATGIVLLLVPLVARAQRETACNLVGRPITQVSSDTIPGVGRMLFIGGGPGSVRIECPARHITLLGDSAEQFPDHYQVIGNASYDEPRLHVTGQYLNYFPNLQRIVGAGNVHGRLPNGSTLDGPQAEYLRVMPGRPRAQMTTIARSTVSLAQRDSTGKELAPTTIVADHMHVDGDSSSLIYAGGQVVINRPDLNATGDSAFMDEPHEIMRLMRNPTVDGKREKKFRLTGDLIEVFSRDRKIDRVISKGAATAVSDSMTLKSDTVDLRVKDDLLDHAYAWGSKSRARVVSPGQNLLADSLDVTMPAQHIQLVRALRKAYAVGHTDTVHFRSPPPDTVDWLQGDTILAHFDTVAAKDTTKTPTIRQLVALGHASSLYHLAASDTSIHRPAINHLTARDITINFEKQTVARVVTVDSVQGVYVEPQPDSTERKAKAATDSTKNKKGLPTRGPAPPSVVPVPANPTKPPAKPPTRQ